MEALKFPVRLHGHDALVVIRLPKPMGGNAKVYLRETAKAQMARLYHQSVETGISGRTDSGEEIPINTVGRWLFGVPGYMGHVRVSNWERSDCKVEYPRDSPSVVHHLVGELKKLIEGVDSLTSEEGGVLEAARKWIEQRRPDASVHKKAAFANAVQTMVTGWAGGYGGPSIREHAAGWQYKSGAYSFDEATELLLREDGPIFGPVTDAMREFWAEEGYICFDDDPQDVAELESF